MSDWQWAWSVGWRYLIAVALVIAACWLVRFADAPPNCPPCPPCAQQEGRR